MTIKDTFHTKIWQVIKYNIVFRLPFNDSISDKMNTYLLHMAK